MYTTGGVKGVSAQSIRAASPGRAADLPRNTLTPIKWWAATGVALLSFAAYVLIRWALSGPRPAPKGPVPVPEYMQIAAWVFQTAVPAGALFVVIRFVVIPWRREGRPTFDGLFILAILTVYWLDPLANYAQTFFTYNAQLFNLGSWAEYVPGWIAPNNRHLAEPIAMMLPAYVLWFFGGTALANAVMRFVQSRRPQTSNGVLILLCAGFLFVLDTAIEMVFLLTGLYTYPGAGALTLFKGHYYQFPLFEAFFMMTAWTPWACLRYFRNDRGESVVERGLSRLRVGERAQGALRFLAIVGALQTSVILLYLVPYPLLTLNAGAFPKEILDRPYLTSGICGYGTDLACPSPRLPIQRRGALYVTPDGKLVSPSHNQRRSKS